LFRLLFNYEHGPDILIPSKEETIKHFRYDFDQFI
jgi:hypothetical protein